MNNETPTIKLTGRFPNTFRVREAGDYGTDAPVEYAFEWDDGQKKHFVRISSRTALKLTEAFEKFGYKQIR